MADTLRVQRFSIVITALALASCGGEIGQPRDASMDAAEAIDASSIDAAQPIDAEQPRDAGPLQPPPPPVFPSTIGTLSIGLRTATSTNADTDAPVELCLSDTRCIELDTPDVNDRELGALEVLHFEGFDMARADVTQVTLRTLDPATVDNDRWTPECLELRFDGEPVYCNDAIGAHIGTGASTGEVSAWTDPAVLHEACVTCQSGTLTHGPMQGAHEPDRLRVWARTDATRLVALRLGTTADLSSAPIVAYAYPRPEDDFTVHFEAPGLAPGSEYFFGVEVDGISSSEPRRARTPPAPDVAEPVRFAFGSCTREVAQPIFDHVTALDPDLFFFSGDNHYANSSFLEAHRWHYRRFRAVPERAELVASVATIAAWDDHDFLGNNSTHTCAGAPQALRAFDEYWSDPSHGLPDTPGTFFTHRWGRALEVFVLDCRSYRPDVGDPGRRCTDDPGAVSPPISDGMIGPVQEAWLVDALSASDATFKLVACGSQFTLDGSMDSWASYPAARARLFDAIDRENVGGVVFLSGDIHRTEIRRVARAGSWSIPEITSSPMANSNSSCPSPPDDEATFCYDAGNSFITVDIDPALADPTLVARVYGASGGVLYEETFARSSLGP